MKNLAKAALLMAALYCAGGCASVQRANQQEILVCSASTYGISELEEYLPDLSVTFHAPAGNLPITSAEISGSISFETLELVTGTEISSLTVSAATPFLREYISENTGFPADRIQFKTEGDRVRISITLSIEDFSPVLSELENMTLEEIESQAESSGFMTCS